jgi:hypothetical protein
MKRLGVIVMAACVLAAGCNRIDYPRILRSRLTGSGNLARSFTYSTVANGESYTVRGRVEDDLRYAMVLSYQGKAIVDYVVRDDSLSIRLRDLEFGKRLANTLGDPVVDKALKEGRWVTDPSGAPPLIRTDTGGSKDSTGDPFQDARDVLDFVIEAMGPARDVRLFTLDDVEYRSQLDPWEYPRKERGEERYDLRRPFLPLSASAATSRGAQGGSVGPPQFRKMSVFVKKSRVDRVCSLIDIEGHEEFIALRQRGLSSNPYLRDLLEQIRKGTTPIPIEPRYIVADIRYPSDLSVGLPPNAMAGKLEVFQSAFKQGVESGVLKPTKQPDTTECRRKSSSEGSG